MTSVTVVSFYTPSYDYPAHAERLRAECDALGLPHRIVERRDTGDYLANTRHKPAVLLEAFNALDTALLWIDVDGSILQQPDALNPYLDFMARPKASGPRKWHVGTLYFGRTPAARRFLELWVAALGEGSDESALDRVWKSGQWDGQWGDLPASYFQILQGRTVPSGTVICHRLSDTPAKREAKKGPWWGVDTAPRESHVEVQPANLRFGQHRATTVDLFGEEWLDVPVERFPHYRHLGGEPDVFETYLRSSWRRHAARDPSIAAHIRSFEEDAQRAASDGRIVPITVCCAPDGRLLVVDGNHRTAIAAFHNLPLRARLNSVGEYVRQITRNSGRFGSRNGAPYQSLTIAGKALIEGRRSLEQRHSLIQIDDIVGKRLVDIGCNIGAASFWAWENGAAYVEGWDADWRLVTSALRLAVLAGYPVRFRQVDAVRPPAGRWDTGLLFSVHEHAPGVRAAMVKCRVVYLETHRPKPPPAVLVDGWDAELLGEYDDAGRRRLYRLMRQKQ